MLVAWLTVGQTQFDQRPVAVGLVVVVVARQSPTHGGKGSEFLIELVVGIQSGLQRIQALRLVVRVLLESLHMVEAHVTAQTPFRRQLEVLSQTIEQCPRELGVEPHEMRTHTDDAVCALVAEARSQIRLGRRAAIEHDVDIGHGVDVHQTNLMADTVVRQVDESHLPALHHGRRDVQDTRPLQTAIHASCDIADTT